MLGRRTALGGAVCVLPGGGEWGQQRGRRIPGSLEVHSREMGAGKTLMQRNLLQSTLTLSASS